MSIRADTETGRRDTISGIRVENTLAPCEPPSTSRRNRSCAEKYPRPAKAAMAGRTGLPVSTVATPAGMALVLLKLSAMVEAKRDKARLARPNTAFCSCSTTFGRGEIRREASTGGTDG